MKRTIRRHLPANKSKWKIYFKLFYPMIFGATLFALNGFVDNFMVGHISQGVTALSAVNSWTGIIIGVFVGIAASGSITMGKYYFSNDYEKAKDVFRLRIQISVIAAIIFSIAMLSANEAMIKVFLKESDNKSSLSQENYSIAFENAKKYSKIMTLQWVLIAVSFNLGTPLREIGHGKVTIYYGLGTLTTNIALNAILMYGFQFGVSGAAWGTVAARIVAIIWCTTYMIKKQIKIRFNFWEIYIFKKQAVTDFMKNWFMFVSYSSTTIFIILRNYFYDAGYTVSSDTIGKGVGAMSVLALTGAIVNVFMTTFSCLASISINVVGSDVAKNNLKQARTNAYELKGFLTIMSIFMSLSLVIFASIVPYLEFFSKNQYDSSIPRNLIFDSNAQLISVRNTSYVIAFFYPFWIWFSSSYRIAASAGKGKWFAFIDWFTTGPIQLTWAAFVMLYLVPNSGYLQRNFWMSYSIFFLSDFIKLILMEIIFYRLNWDKDDYKSKKIKMIKSKTY
ncbi:MAG: MATE family efflux transporter [Mycoplasmatales bacterium]|nr:MATE family efflux transporter [Mycoplasmatales bacterium]